MVNLAGCDFIIDNVLVSYNGTTTQSICETYRFGLNGKEKTDEWNGNGNIYDYGFRIYDPRIGMWLAVDAIKKAYISPYCFGKDNPIIYKDPDGKDDIYFNFLTGQITYRPALGPNKFYAYIPGLTDEGGNTIYYQLHPETGGRYASPGDFVLTTSHETVFAWPFSTEVNDSHYWSLVKYSQANPQFLELLKKSNTAQDKELAKRVEMDAAFATAQESTEEFANNILILSGIYELTGAASSVLKARFSNLEVRQWYNQQLSKLNTAVELTEENAKLLTGQRNALKAEARSMMADRKAAATLEKTDPIRPFEYYVEKYKSQGYSGEELWGKIIKSSSKANANVNAKFGIIQNNGQ